MNVAQSQKTLYIFLCKLIVQGNRFIFLSINNYEKN